jgi:serine/threonine-protein kinase
MQPERWREVEAVFQVAREREPGERAAFLDQVCGRDVALRQEVESLLRADADASGFMEPPGAATAGPLRRGASEGASQHSAGDSLREHLQAALGNGYSVERELGGGGMSRVFVVQETALGRRVVVKVMPPELAAGLDAERFHREIHVAASLQHPHVVPLHSAGQAQGLLYYTMPFVEGESLRHRLERQGALPVAEAVRLLREITDALCYAHRQGIIHRDLKPANILLEEGHALVTDFGIAKALFAATGGATTPGGLTSTGLVLGTPAYMAPEQAAGDQIDHRADLYALGCLAYELLTGQPPFAGASAQALIAAHVADVPEPVMSRRQGIPRELNELVMRLLQKRPADRPQSADEVLRDLETLSMPGRRVPLLGILGIYLACSLGVLGLAYLAMVQLGLPDWVVPSAIVLLLVGLPIILATASLQGPHRATVGGGARAVRPRSSHWLTWRRAISGGVLAFSGLGLVVATYMALRALGVGPVGTLLATGVLKDRERVLLADFENHTRDSLLGNVVTNAFRIDLTQSTVVNLVSSEQVAEALERMRRPSTARLDAGLAREVAVREGIKAVITGEIASAGPHIVLSAQLISPRSGEALAARRETASDSTDIIRAVDRLSKKLREKIGESLKSLRAEQPLARVTTGSLQALRKYTQAIRVVDVEGNTEKAIALGEEAVALDTGFAAAYGLLGLLLFQQYEQERAVRAFTNAFRHRARLTERERYVIMGSYYDVVTHQPEKAIAAYRALLDINPEDVPALHNLGTMYFLLRQYARAEQLFRRAVVASPTDWQGYVNLTWAQVALGKRREAEATVGRAVTRFPDNPWIDHLVILLAGSGGDHEAAEARARTLQEKHGESLFWRGGASELLGLLAAARGKLSQAQRHLRDATVASSEEGDIQQYLRGAISIGLLDILFRHQPTRGLQAVETALARYPLDSLAPLDRPYADLAAFFARAGRPQPARSLLDEHERTVTPLLRREVEPLRRGALGELALAEGRLQDAVAEFRQQASSGDCSICGLYGLGRAFDQMQEPDSALTAYERYVTTPYLDRIASDAFELAPSHKRLGELYEARGNREKAVHHYTRFVELWKDCDPELRPQVTPVRRRLVKLSGEPKT